MRVDEVLAERMDLSLDPSDREQPVTIPLPSDAELIDRLNAVGSAIASGDDLQPPTRIRHLHTIDQVIRRLRK